MNPIAMVELRGQYKRIEEEIKNAVTQCLEQSAFIGGEPVQRFRQHLEQYLKIRHVVPCANGTDALQLAMMALGLRAGDEVIVPAFTYVATAEVIALLRLTPVMVDVDSKTFNVTAQNIKPAITERTRAIVPVHLFGQSCDMAPIMDLANRYNLHVIEDNAQAIGAIYSPPSGKEQAAGTIGTIGCTSFYPSKNLGAYGDGGALFTNDDALAAKLQSIANHGQSSRRYYHEVIGVNSRLDAIQAAILDVKLKYLNDYIAARQRAAAAYDEQLDGLDGVITPHRLPHSTHVFHQYTLQVPPDSRDRLKDFLQARNIPSMVYYPVPLYEQPAFKGITRSGSSDFAVTRRLCQSVISLPMHSELSDDQIAYITKSVRDFFR